MIRKAIREHLSKEKRLHTQGIKVLTLFFIDKVANYRDYDEDGKPGQGRIRPYFLKKSTAAPPTVRITGPYLRA